MADGRVAASTTETDTTGLQLIEELRKRRFVCRGGTGDRKTTCPQCSHTRKKQNEPCLNATHKADCAVWHCHSGELKGRKTLVLTARPEPISTLDEDQSSVGKFTVLLGDEIVLHGTRQPLVDGARALVKLGYDANELLTIRPEGAAYNSFLPQPIREWAQLTYKESERRPLRRTRWEPFPSAHRLSGKQGADGRSVGGTPVDTHPRKFRRIRPREWHQESIPRGSSARCRKMTNDDVSPEKVRLEVDLTACS